MIALLLIQFLKIKTYREWEHWMVASTAEWTIEILLFTLYYFS